MTIVKKVEQLSMKMYKEETLKESLEIEFGQHDPYLL